MIAELRAHEGTEIDIVTTPQGQKGIDSLELRFQHLGLSFHQPHGDVGLQQARFLGLVDFVQRIEPIKQQISFDIIDFNAFLVMSIKHSLQMRRLDER